MSDRLVNLFRQLIRNEVLRQRFENILINIAATPVGSTMVATSDAQLPEITVEDTDTSYAIKVSAGRFGGISWSSGIVYIEKLDTQQEFVLVGKGIVSLVPIEHANNIKGIILAYIYVPANPSEYMFGLDKESNKLQILRGFGAWSMVALRQYPDWISASLIDASLITGELHLDEGVTITNADGSVRLTSTGLEIYGAWDTTVTTDIPEPKLLAQLVGGGLYFYNADGDILSSYRADGALIAGWVIEPLRLYSGNIELSALGEIKTIDYLEGVQGWKIAGDGSAEFNNITARGHIEADSGQVGGWNISLTQLSSGNIIIDSAGEIRSVDYTSGTSGWKVSGDGTAEFNDVTVRGHVEADTGTIGGWEITATSLRSGTDIELEASSKQIRLDNGQVVLGQNVLPDKTGLKIDTNNYFYYDKLLGGGIFKAGSATRYISFDGTDVEVAGKIIADLGSIGGWSITSTELVSPNNGIYLKSADNRLEIRNAGTLKLAVGYLGGVGTHDASEFGIWVGAPNALYIEAAPDEEVIQQISGDWIVNNDADIILKNGSGQEILRIGSEGADLGLFIKDGASGNLFVKYTHQNITFYDINTGEVTVNVSADGSGSLAKGNISWDVDGNLTINASMDATTGTIGGWDITDTSISKIYENGWGIIISSEGYIQTANYSSGIRGWQLMKDGSAEFNNVAVRGHIEAGTGNIGGWNIYLDQLSSGAIVLDANAKQITVSGASRTVKFGYNVVSGQHGLYLDSYNYFVWDDNTVQGKFRVGTSSEYLQFDGTNVEVSGTINAASGVIGGWTIADNKLFAGGITLDAATGTISAVDFQFKEGSVVIGDPGNSYLTWDGVNLHVLGNLIVSAGDDVIRFKDSDIELYDYRGQLLLGGALLKEYFGVVYKYKDSTVNLDNELIEVKHWRYDGQSYSGGPVDSRTLYWQLENEYKDVDGNLLDGGFIWGEVARPMPGYDQSRHIHWEFYVKSNGSDKGWRYTTVRPEHILEHWENTYDGSTVWGEIRFSSIQNYPNIGDNPTAPARGIFAFKDAPINVLISDPVLEYPSGTIFVYGASLFYRDVYGEWRKITGETVSAF